MPRVLWLALMFGYMTGIGASFATLSRHTLDVLLAPVAVVTAIILIILALIMLFWRAEADTGGDLDAARENALPHPAESDTDDTLAPFLDDAPEKPGEWWRPGPSAKVIGGGAFCDKAQLARAIEQGRAEVLVQPIVTLPQRRTTFFACSTGLHRDDGKMLGRTSYLPAENKAGLTVAIDRFALMGAVRLARHLADSGSEARIFVDLAATSLADKTFVDEIVDILVGLRKLAGSLVLQIDDASAAVDPLGAVRRLRRLGVQLAVRYRDRSALDAELLAAQGYGYVTFDAADFRGDAENDRLNDDLAHLSDRLDKAGIAAIVEGISSERALVDILDYPVHFGRGSLFGKAEPLAA